MSMKNNIAYKKPQEEELKETKGNGIIIEKT